MNLQDASHIATVIGAMAVVGVFIQIVYAKKQLKADHERSRREKAVEMLIEWAKSLKRDNSLARKIIESLSEEQCRNLYNQDKVKISSKHEAGILKILSLSSDDIKKENDEIIITEEQSAKLRWHAVSFLNLLESILVSWQYSIVDREIIEHEFSYLFSQEQGHEALKYFRIAAGGVKSFPAIEIFANHLDEELRKILKEKAYIA